MVGSGEKRIVSFTSGRTSAFELDFKTNKQTNTVEEPLTDSLVGEQLNSNHNG